MMRREPIQIGELMRQMGIVRPSQFPLKGEDWEVDKDLVCALFYYESLMNERMNNIKIENLPAWAEKYNRHIDRCPWFVYVAPLIIQDYEWCQNIIKSYPHPQLLEHFWETVLSEFCYYIRCYHEFKAELSEPDEPLGPYVAPEGSLNWKIDQIHGVSSARTAFEHFIDITKPKGGYIYYRLLMLSCHFNIQQNVDAGEDCF